MGGRCLRLGPHACYHSIGRIVLVGSQLQGAAWSGGSASKGHTLQGLSACDDPLSPLWFILKQYAHSRPQVSDPAIVSEYDAKLQSEGLGTESFPLDAGSGGPLDISGAGDSLADGSFDEESKLDIADGTLDGQQNEFSAVWCSSQHSLSHCRHDMFLLAVLAQDDVHQVRSVEQEHTGDAVIARRCVRCCVNVCCGIGFLCSYMVIVRRDSTATTCARPNRKVGVSIFRV